MGTPVAKIIAAAFREGNILAIGATPTPNQQSEALDRLNRLVAAVYGTELGETLADWQIPAPQRTAPVGSNYPQLPYPINNDPFINPIPLSPFNTPFIAPYPAKNSRIVYGGTNQTIYFPEQPDNGSRMGFIQASGAGDTGTTGDVLTIDANGRFIVAAGQTTLQITFSTTSPAPPQEWIYLAEQGVWFPVLDLTLTSSMPFAERFDDFWITALFARMAPTYNKQVSGDTSAALARDLMALIAAYKQMQPTVYGFSDIPPGAQAFGGYFPFGRGII